MEPIVPKPEERISSNQGQKKTRPHHPEPTEYEQDTKWGLLPGKFSLPSILILIFAILMVILFGMQQQSIGRLEQQLASLDPASIAPNNNEAPDNGDDSSEKSAQSIIPGVDDSKALKELTKQINFLWKTLESHTSELATLRTKVETPVAGSDQGEAGKLSETLQASSATLKALQAELATLTKRIEVTEQNIGSSKESHQAWQLTQAKNIDGLNQKIAGLETQVSKSVKDSIGTTTAQLQKEFKVALDEKSAQQSRVISSLEKQVEQQKNETGKLLQTQSGLGKQVQEASQQVQVSLNKAVADMKSQISAESASNSKLVATQGARINTIAKSLDEQKTQTAQLKQAQDQLSTRVGQLDKGWQTALNATKSDLKSSQSDLLTKFSSTQTKLTSLETKLASVSRISTTAANTAANTAGIDSVMAEVNREIAALSTKLDSSVNAIKTQESSFKQWRAQVDQQLARALASGNTSTTPAINPSSIQELKTQLSSQVSTLKQLQEKDSQLARDISSSKTQLLSLQGTIAKLQQSTSSGGASSKPGMDLTSVENQLADLAVKIDSTQSKVSVSEAQMVAWQRKVDSQLASQTGASGSGSSAQDMATIKAIVKLLMGHHPYTDFPPLK